MPAYGDPLARQWGGAERRSTWRRVADLPHPVVAAPSPAPSDAAGFYVLGGDDGSQVGSPPEQHRGFTRLALRYDGKSEKWAAAGGVPARTDAIQSPEFLEAGPFNQVYADSVARMRDMWNVPEYAKLIDIENTNVNAALNGAKDPEQALNDIAAEQQKVLDSAGGGGL